LRHIRRFLSSAPWSPPPPPRSTPPGCGRDPAGAHRWLRRHDLSPL